MNAQKDSIAILLANRCYLLSLLRRIFADEPDVALITVAASQHTYDALQIMVQEDENQFDPFCDLLAALDQSMVSDREATLDKLRSEYTRLLLGPEKLPAPPWESVYMNEDRSLFTERTLEVRQAYVAYGYIPVNYPHDADDHIALELDFMLHLAELTQNSFEQDDIKATKKLLLDQKAFLEQHLLAWVGIFADQIKQSKTSYFYPQMAKLTEQVLKVDFEALNQLLFIFQND